MIHMLWLTAVAFAAVLVAPLTDLGAGTDVVPKLVAAKNVSDKAPIPADKPLRKAKEIVQAIYADEYQAAADDAERRALAGKMIGDLSNTVVPAEQYALLMAARRIALTTCDVELIVDSIRELDQRFAIDALAMRAESLMNADKASLAPENRKKLGLAMLAVIDPALQDERLDLAQRLVQTVQQLAREMADGDLLDIAERWAKVVEELKSEFDLATAALVQLKRSPNDAEACNVAGQYLCFVRGDWEQGLPLLAKGSDAELSKLAQQELAGLRSPTEQAALADAWWTRADRVNERKALQQRAHAAYWYHRAFDSLDGLRKVKVEKMLDAFAGSNPELFDVVRNASDVNLRPSELRTADGWIRLTMTKLGVLKDDRDGSPVTGVEFSVDFEHLAAFSSSPDVIVWDLQSLSATRLSGHTSPVRSAAFQRYGEELEMVTGGDDMTVRRWSLKSGDVQVTMQGHTGPVVEVGFLPGGRDFHQRGFAVVSSSDREVCIWSREGLQSKTLSGNCAAIAPRGRAVAYQAEGEVRLWFPLEKRETKLRGSDLDVRQMRFSPDGRNLAASCGGDESCVRIWDVSNPDAEPILVPCTSDAILAFSPDGKTLAVTNEREVALLDVASLQRLVSVVAAKGIQAMALSGDGAHMAVVEKGSPEIQLYRIDSRIRRN